MSRTNMKTLAARKREKSFIGVMEKDYPRKPEINFSLSFWFERLNQEIFEVKHAKNIDEFRDELADLSNIIDFMYERTFYIENLNEIGSEEPIIGHHEFDDKLGRISEKKDEQDRYYSLKEFITKYFNVKKEFVEGF